MFRISVLIEKTHKEQGRVGSAGTFRVNFYKPSLKNANRTAHVICRDGVRVRVEKHKYMHIPVSRVLRADVEKA